MRECSCGSGLDKHALVDAAGIFCTYVCDACEEEKASRYNPEIFNGSGRYASTGEEEDILIEYAEVCGEREQHDAHCYREFDDELFRISCVFATSYGSQLFLLSDCFGGTTTRDVLRS